jgi:hypothetical protein
VIQTGTVDHDLEAVRADLARSFDLYVRSVPDEVITRDLERDLVSATGVALALIRQRKLARDRVEELLRQVDGLEQLLAMIHDGRRVDVVREDPAVVAIGAAPRVLIADSPEGS